MRRHLVVAGAICAALAVHSAMFPRVAGAQDEQPPDVSPAQQGLRLEAKCDIEGALAAYREALKTGSRADPRVLLAIARLSSDETDLRGVAEAAEAQSGSSGGMMPPSLVAAAVYAKLGEHEKSRETLNTAARAAEKRTGSNMKPMARAIKDIASLDADTRSPLIVALLGAWSPCADRKKAAAEQLQAAARADIESGYVRFVIAAGLIMAGRMDLALEEAKKAEPAAKDDPELARLLQMFQPPPAPANP